MLEEQLQQHMMIDTLKLEVFENRKLLQNLVTMLKAGPLSVTTEQMQEKPKQRLKRKDTKHMWWDVSNNLLMKLTILNILFFFLYFRLQ